MKNHVWIVEAKIGGKWTPVKFFTSRANARQCRARVRNEARVRKFVAVN